MENFSGDQKDIPNKQENSHKLCNEKRYPLLILKNVNWDNNMIRISHDQNFVFLIVAILELFIRNVCTFLKKYANF